MHAPNIAVLSDTHDSLPDRLLHQLSGASEIWHLGDVCSPAVIEPLRRLAVPLSVVRGNCDPGHLWPEQLQLERGGYTFILRHQPPHAIRQRVDAILHGHLHQPIHEEWDDVSIRSPGAITAARNGYPSSFAWLRFPAGAETWSWQIEALA